MSSHSPFDFLRSILFITFLFGVFLFFSFQIYDLGFQYGKVDTSTKQHIVSPTPPNKSQLANPASVNCEKVGGKLSIQKDGSGNEYGLCQFADNMACEEWALFTGDCPVGGVKTTGYDTLPQKYCAWLGGKTLAVKNATCTFPNGKICKNEELYQGTCQH